MVLNNRVDRDAIVEFGSGDGSPVIKALLRSDFNGTVHGFELNASACEIASARVQEYELEPHYQLYNTSFFEADRPIASVIISNPPYLPAIDNNLYQPLLHGGIDGITITKKLLELGYDEAMMMISSYSNPKGLIDFAEKQGYCVSNFLVSPLPFGYYSSDPKVKSRITEMREQDQAFYSSQMYCLAGVLFSQRCETDLTEEFLKVITTL
ncbi:SAM-dependent methyltransferase [Microcoleus sp. FACHB-1515]|uniref:SAM-dependent methyltransferase n=1 Tax=Cyanophyceae TaxID=3028117 RepID=UPI001F55311B|nr:SAM-dependent methyltransferase [Microcoleus sp. FACHB-1515]